MVRKGDYNAFDTLRARVCVCVCRCVYSSSTYPTHVKLDRALCNSLQFSAVERNTEIDSEQQTALV